jgi:hypothetical protein
MQNICALGLPNSKQAVGKFAPKFYINLGLGVRLSSFRTTWKLRDESALFGYQQNGVTIKGPL